MLALMEANAEDEEREQEHGEHEPALGVAPSGAAATTARRSRRLAAGRLPGSCSRCRADRRGEAAQRHRHGCIMDPARTKTNRLAFDAASQ